MSEQIKYLLNEDQIPKVWYNLQADLPKPLPPVRARPLSNIAIGLSCQPPYARSRHTSRGFGHCAGEHRRRCLRSVKSGAAARVH